jgi:hypothetical protein
MRRPTHPILIIEAITKQAHQAGFKRGVAAAKKHVQAQTAPTAAQQKALAKQQGMAKRQDVARHMGWITPALAALSTWPT